VIAGSGSKPQTSCEELIYSSARHHWNPLSAPITTHILLKGDEVDADIIGLVQWPQPICLGHP